MSLSLVATAGATNANSYATIAQANTYHEGHLYASTWNDQEQPAREQALVMATRLLDRLFTWTGAIADDLQALRWPRVSTYDADGRLLSSTAIPQPIIDATSELARWLLASDRTATKPGESVASVDVGDVSVTFAGAGSDTTGGTIPTAVRQLVGHLGTYRELAESAGAINLYRG